MLGILSVQTLPDEPCRRLDNRIKVGTISFCSTAIMQHQEDGFMERLQIRKGLRSLKARGVTQVAAPQDPFIRKLLPRYDMHVISHMPLMRVMAPQIMDHILQHRKDGAVVLYAKSLDDQVLAAAYHAVQQYETVMLELGRWSGVVQEKLMECCGASALEGVVSVKAGAVAAMLFDCPPEGLFSRLHFVKRVALCEEVVSMAEYNDMKLKPVEGIPKGTDCEAVASAVVSADTTRAAELTICDLIKN